MGKQGKNYKDDRLHSIKAINHDYNENKRQEMLMELEASGRD